MQLRWKYAEPAVAPKGRKPKPGALPNQLGLEAKELLSFFRSREKNILDIPSYRSGVITSLRRLFAIRDNECNRDFSPT